MLIIDSIDRAIWNLAAWFGMITLDETSNNNSSSSSIHTNDNPGPTRDLPDELDPSRGLPNVPETTPSAPPLPGVPQAAALVNPPRLRVFVRASPMHPSPVRGVRSPRPPLPPHRAVQAARQAFLYG